MVTFIRYEVWCLIGAFFLLIGYRTLTGNIKISGLVLAKDREGGISPARIQLLVFTLTGAFYYLMTIIGNPCPNHVPDIPRQLLIVLGGSNLFYAGSKVYSLAPWHRGEANEEKPKKGGT